MNKGYRQGRLGEEIRKIISEALLKEIKDPRLSSEMISVSDVHVSADGSYATCYVTVLFVGANEEERKRKENQVLEGLESAKGVFRNRIGKLIKLRRAPQLIFKIDRSLEYERHISEVIDRLESGHEK